MKKSKEREGKKERKEGRKKEKKGREERKKLCVSLWIRRSFLCDL